MPPPAEPVVVQAIRNGLAVLGMYPIIRELPPCFRAGLHNLNVENRHTVRLVYFVARKHLGHDRQRARLDAVRSIQALLDAQGRA